MIGAEEKSDDWLSLAVFFFFVLRCEVLVMYLISISLIQENRDIFCCCLFFLSKLVSVNCFILYVKHDGLYYLTV